MGTHLVWHPMSQAPLGACGCSGIVVVEESSVLQRLV